ncbi:PREDICTED: coiled-coil and C2 domain-containing protein 2A-like [Priapulus caudatus]|uniref:Coiled-coil and C2 domain-containing protein 2A-like n=1 Tax=Priapulus caudatus TaxID=37621 RepID=A0ABM1E2Z1_PRICU|nr:PREDICTED: coiled-coil and C2 domain-containing protein 2A-like [Priapulus caudatus]
MLCGDEDEHAVLLCNYFLHLNKQAWLCIGSAVPEGRTVYVLTREDGGKFWLWCASTGHTTAPRQLLPLQAVWCLINQENIWANMQKNEQPSRMSFNLTKVSDWKPLFSKSYLRPALTSVQPESLVYASPISNKLRISKNALNALCERKSWSGAPYTSRDGIATARRYSASSYPGKSGTNISHLRKLEESHGAAAAEEHGAELQSLLTSYKVLGFPLNMAYTDIAAVVQQVAATRVHAVETSDVEFALAVYIHAYPGNVLSVWVYVGSLVRRR